jgi:predicted flap endonuclease-1-like 5' DNA nuclease
MYLVLLQTPSTGGAALEIIVMLLGAAMIGVVTTYFYMKSKYQKTISTLQSKLEEAEKSKDRLNETLQAAQKELAEKSDQYAKLQKQYDELMKKEKVMEQEAAEGKKATRKLHQTEKELKEREELLKRISERKHMINYSRIGTARMEDKDDLKMISGIGPFIEEQLHTLDIFTFEQISKFEKEDVAAVTEAIEFFPGRIERDEWVAQAKELL